MNLIKTNLNNRKPVKTRRTFLQTMGMFIAGLGLPRPLLSFGNRETVIENESLTLQSGGMKITQEAVRLPQGVRDVWDLNKA